MTIGGLIVTHGRLGEILVEETLRLTGPAERFQAFSTLNMSAADITSGIQSVIRDEPWIIFADSPGTAPAVRSAAALSDGQALITGVNIPMLLSFILHRPSHTIEELVARLVRDGQRCVKSLWTNQDTPSQG